MTATSLWQTRRKGTDQHVNGFKRNYGETMKIPMKLPANQGKLICRRSDDDLEPLLFFNRTDGKAKLTHLITCDWLELAS